MDWPRRAAMPLGDFGRARYLILGQLLTSTGTGAMMAATAVFLVRSAGLPVGQIGIGMAVVGAAGLVSLPAVGALTDRCGAREVAVVSTALAASATACFGWIDSLGTFIVIEGMANSALQAAAVAQRALVGQAMAGTDRVRFQAVNRSAANLGYSLGALAAVPAMAVDTRRSYLLLFFAAAAASASALPCTWFGPRPAGTAIRRPPWTALTDARYLVATVLCGLLTARHKILTLAIPVWIVLHTAAPADLAGILLFVNTVMVILLQVRMSGRASTLHGAAEAVLLGGLAFTAAFGVLTLSATTSAGIGAAVLILAVIPFTLAEMWTSAAAWTYSYGLAPPDLHGQYQAVFALGRAGGDVVGPLLASAAVALGVAGWGVVAAFFAVTCALIVGTAPWITRHAPA